MAWLVDTNVAPRWSRREDPDHVVAASAVRALKRRRETLLITPQNLVEFWNAATRPADRNGFGLTVVEAARALAGVESLLTLLRDSEAVYPMWKHIVMEHGVSGVQVHDARLAAFMRVHGVANILTFNVRHFQRFPALQPCFPKTSCESAEMTPWG